MGETGAEPHPRVAILMATFNGGRFIGEQLESIRAQDWPAIDVRVSDDGSSDDTLAVLERWKDAWGKGRIDVAEGPRAGFLENFRSLLASGPRDADYVGFSDQDDIWDPDKVGTAVGRLSCFPREHPALYCSRTRLVDQEGNAYGNSPLFARPPSFLNALVQSIAGGNTMLMNAAAFALLCESARRTTFVSHDWWAYMLVSGAGGTVVYDPEPHIAYRQHLSNLVGDNMGLAARSRRILGLLRGRLLAWNETNFAALEACQDMLTEENRALLHHIQRARLGRPIDRWRDLKKLGLYRQTRSASLAMFAAAALGKF